jgi:branched-chain amino acid transport system ATP-binding protein
VSDLVVKDLSMAFGGVKALDGLSLTVEENSICGLIGPNGAGKTTLFNCVGRVYQPDQGSIVLDGVDLLTVPANRIAHHGVARTFQNLGLFPTMTFLDNTLVGAHPAGRTGYLRAISRWGVRAEEREMRSFSYSLLEMLGLDIYAHDPAAEHPFPTLKRLELARALAARPKVLLLDEPAGGLAHGEVEEFSALIKQIREEFGLTVLLVEHHMGMVMGISDRLVAMNFGRKIAEGGPDEVRSHPVVVSAYLGAPA